MFQIAHSGRPQMRRVVTTPTQLVPDPPFASLSAGKNYSILLSRDVVRNWRASCHLKILNGDNAAHLCVVWRRELLTVLARFFVTRAQGGSPMPRSKIFMLAFVVMGCGGVVGD